MAQEGTEDEPQNRVETGDRSPVSGKFAPGNRANPGGRPKALAEFRELCREKSPTAVLKLSMIMLGKNPAAAVKAAELILAYAWGRPNQPLTGDDGGAMKIQDVTREEALAALRAVTGKKGKEPEPAPEG